MAILEEPNLRIALEQRVVGKPLSNNPYRLFRRLWGVEDTDTAVVAFRKPPQFFSDFGRQRANNGINVLGVDKLQALQNQSGGSQSAFFVPR